MGFSPFHIYFIEINDYRVGEVGFHLRWIDINFRYSTTCLILPGQLEVWYNGLCTDLDKVVIDFHL